MASPNDDDDSDMHSYRLEELNEIMERIRWEASQSESSTGVVGLTDGALHQLAMQRLAERRLARRRLLLSSSSADEGSFRAAAVTEPHTGGSWFRGAIRRAGSAYRHLMEETTSPDNNGGANAATEPPQEPSFVCSRRGSNYMLSSSMAARHSYAPSVGQRRDSIGAALAEIERGGYGYGGTTAPTAGATTPNNGSDRSSPSSDGDGGIERDDEISSSEGRRDGGVRRRSSLPGNGCTAADADRRADRGFSRRSSLPGDATMPRQQRRSSLTMSSGGRRGSVSHRRGSMAGRRGSLASVDERRASLVGAACDGPEDRVDDDNRKSIHVLDLPFPSSRIGRRNSNGSFLSMESSGGLTSQTSLHETSATDGGLICGWNKPRRRRSVASLSSCGSFDHLYVDFPHRNNSCRVLDSLDDSSVTYKASYRLVAGNRMVINN